MAAEWQTTDETAREFYIRLAEALFPYNQQTGELMVEPWFEDFREHCALREIAGRETFGFTYLSRSNEIEATEEAADGAIYMLLHGLRARREGWEPEDDVRFTAAYHFAKAHQYSRMLRAKRRGDTGPGMDQ